METKKMTYNIPGIGSLSANLFDYTREIYSILDYYGHICRLRRIAQLGPIRDIFQGAHHNRFEYVFLQLSIISELCNNKRNELGLSSKRQFCGKLDRFNDFPSAGELLQCLVLLTNMGYLNGTFANARAWITFLRQNQKSRYFFKQGLAIEDRVLFERIVAEYDYYNFNLILALFQLQRYKRKGKDFVDFASLLLRVYISPTRKDIQQVELKRLYDSIRQISFITLDSIYAPVPFNLDLASVLLNFDNLIDSLFINNTSYRIALFNLERVLQDSVYLCADSCINTARASESTYLKLEELQTSIEGINQLSILVCPSRSSEVEFQDITEQDWLKERKLIQEYRLRPREWESLSTEIKDELTYEISTRKKLGSSRSRVGLLLNSRKNTIKVAFGIISSDNEQSLRVALKIAAETTRLKKVIPQNYPFQHSNNDDNLLLFLCKAIFGWNKRFIFENKNRSDIAIFISNGRLNMLKQIDKYLSSASTHLKPNELFEVRKVRKFIHQLYYSGVTIAFVGGAKLFEQNRNQESAEFDGIVMLPTKNPTDNFAYIIEAKNYRNGITNARNQLNTRLTAQLIPELEMDIQTLDNRCAYAGVKIK